MAESSARSGPMSYFEQARNLASSGSYAKAFDAYIVAFEKNPALKSDLEAEFRQLLNILNEYLVASKKIGNVFANFERAIETFPGNIYILNEIGKYLYKFGFYKESCCHFQKALYIDSGYVAAEKNLNSVKNVLVERWHFRMLNDKIRNKSYRKAIHECMVPGKDSILDLGSGTGIFTIYGHECKPYNMTTVESSEVMASIARNIFAENGVRPVTSIIKMSINIKDITITGKNTIVVTELFDAGLFGENILKTLIHAWENLIPNNGHVLPSRAEYFVVGVNCNYLSCKYQLSSSAKTILNISDLVVQVASTEPYDCDDIHLIKDIKYMTEPYCLLKVNFNNIVDLKKVMSKTRPYKPKLRTKEAGEINMIVGWFNLHITDSIMLTSNPLSVNRANAWQQAIFFNYVPSTFEENDLVPVEFTTRFGKLAMVPNHSTDIKVISTEMLRFLNDADYMKMITSCVETVCIYLGQNTEVCDITIVDLSPFPVLGLLMMKRGACSLICYARTVDDKLCIELVCLRNKVNLSNVTILLGEFNQEVFKDQKFNLIVTNILDLCGDVNIQFKQLTIHLRNAHLVQGGLVLPYKITLKGQLVYSNWLNINNRVDDTNVGNFTIGKFINIYQVSQNFHLELAHLEYDAVSDPVDIANINIEMTSDVINVKIKKDCQVNAVLCWYEIELMEKGDILTTNRANSLIDSMAFLAHPMVKMKSGQNGNIIKCVDLDGTFKLVIDVDT